ncbi:ribosome biogenesis protein BOP1 homolog, partial [Penaeus japonicus]|uniref:ribosome biogenesis protein BOP1 homolog n=1 Tax=Penaeus japonicus TaxID=27405 RepID=UPI001C717B28
MRERYERCLDLYLAPRKLIKKSLHKADDMLPRMPKPKDLRPFPTREALRFVGHQSVVRTISIHPLGKFLASGSDDRTVKSKSLPANQSAAYKQVIEISSCVSLAAGNLPDKWLRLATRPSISVSTALGSSKAGAAVGPRLPRAAGTSPTFGGASEGLAWGA